MLFHVSVLQANLQHAVFSVRGEPRPRLCIEPRLEGQQRRVPIATAYIDAITAAACRRGHAAQRSGDHGWPRRSQCHTAYANAITAATRQKDHAVQPSGKRG